MEIKRALELDPLSPLIDSNLVWALDDAGQYDQAIEWDTKALELDANFMPALFDPGLSHVQTSMYKEATAHFEKAVMDPLKIRYYWWDSDTSMPWRIEAPRRRRCLTLAMPWVAPISNPLRSDPCRADLLRRMNLQP